MGRVQSHRLAGAIDEGIFINKALISQNPDTQIHLLQVSSPYLPSNMQKHFMTIVSAALATMSAGVAAYSNKYERRRPLLSFHFLNAITFLCLPRNLTLAARIHPIAPALPTAT